jgi:hypothetical protein
MGCDTKLHDICLLCVSGIQRLITHQIVSSQAGANIVSMLAQLMDWNFDSIRVLQTSMLLLSTTTCVRGKTLSNCLSLVSSSWLRKGLFHRLPCGTNDQ